MARRNDELVFVALGGLGEIGMNLGLYGFGPEDRRKWVMVDCGISFAGEEAPGVDLVFPDIRFIVEERRDLLGIVITHAHEDHIGALARLWPQLEVPVYCTPFAAGLLEMRRLSEPGAPKIPLRRVAQNGRINLDPFDIELIPVAHSIPEATALAIRTPLGTVLHTGDWRLDPEPVVGRPTDGERLAEIGDEGVLAMVCDSTNALRDGISPSETEVANNLAEIIAASPHRVAVTTFASNVARVRAVALAAQKAGRDVVVVGRAMDRVVSVAGELGYLDGLPPFLSPEVYDQLPRDKVVALLTGSQGEGRAAMARVATDTHPDISLAAGDRVIFSSRAIPGNEKAINTIINNLVRRGVEVITDHDALVHASGHPRRGELEQMYQWVRPRIVLPVHGEPMHLAGQREFARKQGVQVILRAEDGEMVRFAPGEARVIDEVPVGRVYQDGDLLVDSQERTIPERRKLAFAGVVSVAIALTDRGELAGDVSIGSSGLPPMNSDGEVFDEAIGQVVVELIESLPKARRRDPDAVVNAVERAVRSEVQRKWGKKPVCHAHVITV
ncbi:ribonuclease J [Pseudochelatococcus contaminans]|uniref:Ribonuclease J n=1 Tax=Pseudochelatococcus contaminans TaxID=1538103 RepID=A0A7W6EEX3_9HYPH|nr:ribonuclease J [Pseudochelatococcus contaminans]MBB3808474.1 ribonuclease J [Pseudochelatococcus contaminans]